MKSLILTLLAAALALPAAAQAVNEGGTIQTVGRTIESDGSLHDYLVWQPGDAANTFGKSFAVYRKAGDAASVNPFTRLSETRLQTAPGAILALLQLGASFDHDAAALPGRLSALHAEALSQPVPDPAPAALGPDSAARLAEILGVAATDAEILDRLFFFGRIHPGVMLCLGHAFHIPATHGQVWTYEVRETDGSGNDVRVIGRTTLEAGNPQPLTAPGPPVAVRHPVDPDSQLVASGKDNLVARLRWRSLTDSPFEPPHRFGYNVYRVRDDVAESNGWHTTAPDAQLLEDLAAASAGQPDPDGVRANMLPILATDILDSAAANDASDLETFFFSDDIKGRPAGLPPIPFADGDTYYYFVAARDIAGHPGPVSPGTRVVLCRRVPPPAPTILGVDNTFTAPASPTGPAALQGEQRLKLRIERLENDDDFTYYVYRWNRSGQALEQGGNPAMGLVDSITPGTDPVIEWIDDGPGSPSINSGNDPMADKVVWYTVRAEDNTACSPKNLSYHSPPASGVLRDRADPGSPTGSFEICTITPVATYLGQTTKPTFGLDLPGGFQGFVIQVERTSERIARFRLEVRNDANDDPFLIVNRAFGNSSLVLIPVETNGTTAEARLWGYTWKGTESNEAKATLEKEASQGAFVDCLEFEIDAIKSCDPPTGDPDDTHEVIDLDGSISGITGTLTLPTDTWEYRVYRRVGDDGPLEMIARGSGDTLPANVDWADTAPPTANGAQVCFYGQVLDQNGNAGPLVHLGCTTISNEQMPTPLLAAPTPLPAADGVARVRLNWFCDPVGVERFILYAASDSAALEGIDGANLSAPLGEPGPIGAPEPYDGFAFTGVQTAALSGSFGSGPDFEVTFNVPASGELVFAVRAVGPGAPGARSEGSISNLVSERWVAPPEEEGELIPWPQRQLPGIQNLTFEVADYQPDEGPFYAMKSPDDWPGSSAAILVGAYRVPTFPGNTKEPFQADFGDSRPPERWFFETRRQQTEGGVGSSTPLLPFAVYRYQLDSGLYQNAAPNLVQVSPLIRGLAYKSKTHAGTGTDYYEISDPFFRFVPMENAPDVPLAGTFSRTPDISGGGLVVDDPNDPANSPLPTWIAGKHGLIYWLDPQAATIGARYQYLIVRFTARGEIDRVIPVNPVQQ